MTRPHDSLNLPFLVVLQALEVTKRGIVVDDSIGDLVRNCSEQHVHKVVLGVVTPRLLLAEDALDEPVELGRDRGVAVAVDLPLEQVLPQPAREPLDGNE